MLHHYSSRLLIVAALIAVLVTAVGVAPASADSRTGRFIAGLAIGALVGAALNDNDRHYSYQSPCYNPPVGGPYRRYDPPYYGGSGYNSPRQNYEYGYRDGYSDGTQNGRRQGYRQGYGDGRRDQYQVDRGYNYGPYSNYSPPCW